MKTAFISYSHADEQYRVELDKHLSLLKRQGHITTWSDHRIDPGGDFDEHISAALEDADLILLLVSADFIHSEYCYGIEMKRALERHDAREAVVVPIILRPCDWKSSPFGRLKALPTDGKAVTKWPSLDDAFLDIVQKMRSMLTAPGSSAATQKVANAPLSPGVTQANPGTVIRRTTRSSNLALPRRFTDEERHDFALQGFQYIRSYFEQSLIELQARNPGITARIGDASSAVFTAIVFRDGQRIGGCRIAPGNSWASGGITYSSSEHASDSSFNELITVETDQNLMYFKATLGRQSFGQVGERLTDEGAAEHLWSMFLAQFHQ
ncbi:toll/interleukin-1 receptor domain-containing protein [Comamonas antarctica]|uniref:Toll/interleukin-1 receptor domain-containing protein n=1 Tax=Comamonas antarctica TaxID=2743470 RepID=A0A6N1XBL3_9BURK|nr:toll/interleukin-1 receptor domain-containing protein [Comamonas antarctica]QKV55462.1 toll/interleukin-1 receptor domain-containing protein [Comamonas antarctica]